MPNSSQVSGIAVHIGARVAGRAKPGEVLASGTVRDIVSGAGITFEPRGEHVLKGVPRTWRLFSVTGVGPWAGPALPDRPADLPPRAGERR